MGLLMVGYGLRDSISSISECQYGQLQLYDSSVYLSEDIEEEELAELEAYLDANVKVDDYTNATMANKTFVYEEEEIDGYLVVVEDMSKIDNFFTNFVDFFVVFYIQEKLP